MTACPSCFQQLPLTDFAWVCQSGTCTQAEDPKASAYLGGRVESGPITLVSRPSDAVKGWTPPPKVFCRQCGTPSMEACAFCHYPLPPDWRTFDVTTIAMNGARSTGKSFYVGVAIQQLRRLLTKLHSTLEYANTQTQETYFEQYHDPLYEELKIIAPTPRSNTDKSYQRHPMIFALGRLKGIPRVLVVRDIAGEDMEKATEDAPHFSFLRHADGVFFMFDPLAIPKVRESLRGLVPAQLITGGDPRVVLGNLRRIIGTASPRLAVIISKFDGLQVLKKVDDMEWKPIMSNPGAAFMRDPSLQSGEYDSLDGELLSLEVRSLLYKLGAADLVFSLEGGGSRPIPHRFFAVSVLGESPDGEVLSRIGISPFRILDPLKWILNAKNVI